MSKRVVKKLYKIAARQQQIINKMAQAMGLDVESGGESVDRVSKSVELELKGAAKALAPKGRRPEDYAALFSVSDLLDTSPQVHNKKSNAPGLLKGELFYPAPKNDAERAALDKIVSTFKSNMMGKSLLTDDGKDSETVSKTNLTWLTSKK